MCFLFGLYFCFPPAQACQMLIHATPARCPGTGLESVPTLLAQKPNQPHKLCQPSGTATSTLEESLGMSQLPKEPYHPSCRQSDQLPVAEEQFLVARQTTPLLRTIAIENKFKDVLQVRCNYESCNCTELKTDDINVKGRLREHLTFWEEIGTSEIILSVIS